MLASFEEVIPEELRCLVEGLAASLHVVDCTSGAVVALLLFLLLLVLLLLL
jgi:hypothetical protein